MTGMLASERGQPFFAGVLSKIPFHILYLKFAVTYILLQ